MKNKIFLNIGKNDEFYIFKENKCVCMLDSNTVDLAIKDVHTPTIRTEIANIDKNNLEKEISNKISECKKNMIDYEIQLVINYKD